MRARQTSRPARAGFLVLGVLATAPAAADPLITLGSTPLGTILAGTSAGVSAGLAGALGVGTGATAGGGGTAAPLPPAVLGALGTATTLGTGAVATLDAGLALGQLSNAGGPGGIAIGTATVAGGTLSTVVGTAAAATADATVAIGANAQALANNAISVGANAQALAANTVAIGNGALALRNNQVAIGTGSNTYTLTGLTSTASRAVQVGPTQIVTTDSSGNLATANLDVTRLGGLDGRMSNIEATTAALQNDVATLKRDVRRGYEGTAIALAVGGGALPENKRFAMSGNIGTFRGETAVGATAAFRATDLVSFSGGVGAGFARGGVGGRGGMTLAW